jgi:hypothetical protein
MAVQVGEVHALGEHAVRPRRARDAACAGRRARANGTQRRCALPRRSRSARRPRPTSWSALLGRAGRRVSAPLLCRLWGAMELWHWLSK